MTSPADQPAGQPREHNFDEMSDQELRELAMARGIDLPPDIDRAGVIQRIQVQETQLSDTPDERQRPAA